MPNLLNPFQLLELNIISAQDLEQVSRRMQTYAVAWVHPDRKLSTRVDAEGINNPTWNDKFVFRVDDEFLYADTSAVMIEIYAVHWFRDIHVGTVRVIVGNLIPATRSNYHYLQLGMRFVALQVRRPSGRPQGILNIGAALLDSSMRSLPLYTKLSASAVGYRHLMGEEETPTHKDEDKSSDQNRDRLLLPWVPKADLRRTKSIDSSMIGSELVSRKYIEGGKGSSIITASGIGMSEKKGRSKASSMIRTGYDQMPCKEPLYSETKDERSFVSESDVSSFKKFKYKPTILVDDSHVNAPAGLKSPNPTANDYKFLKLHKTDHGDTPAIPLASHKAMNFTNGVPITESELGPSPSEVVAVMARNKHGMDDGESDKVGAWSLETSMEGLQSKLERWRAELPPVFDNGELSGFTSTSGFKGEKRANLHKHRHSDGGLISCFSNVCGVECSIVCGGSSSRRKKGRRMKRSPSMDTLSFL